jgi:hypothetical protein
VLSTVIERRGFTSATKLRFVQPRELLRGSCPRLEAETDVKFCRRRRTLPSVSVNAHSVAPTAALFCPRKYDAAGGSSNQKCTSEIQNCDTHGLPESDSKIPSNTAQIVHSSIVTSVEYYHERCICIAHVPSFSDLPECNKLQLRNTRGSRLSLAHVMRCKLTKFSSAPLSHPRASFQLLLQFSNRIEFRHCEVRAGVHAKPS